MAVTLAITDNADGTGAVATVSGVVGGTSTTVYYSTFTGAMGSYIWTSAGIVVGNSTLATALATGFYVWLAVNDNGGVLTLSSLVYRNLTDATESVHELIVDAVVTRIKSIGLDGITSSKIKRLWVPKSDPTLTPPPAVIVSPLGAEGDESNVMSQDDIGYPVLVVITDALNGNNDLNMRRDLAWREKIAKALRNQRLSGVAQVFDAKIDYGPTIDVAQFFKNAFVSVLMFRFVVRESRGLT
jgi:hypothetical protein